MFKRANILVCLVSDECFAQFRNSLKYYLRKDFVFILGCTDLKPYLCSFKKDTNL